MSKTASWVTLSGTGGTIAAGGSTTVTVSINSDANSLAVGSYSDTVTFTNTTNHQGDTTRAVSLQVLPAMSVTPTDGLTSSGPVGGSFSPSSKVYTLQNTSGSSINYTASNVATWVTLSSTSGTIAASSSTTITVSINTNANSLAVGSYSDTVTFTNTTNHSGDTDTTGQPDGQPAQQRSVRQRLCRLPRNLYRNYGRHGRGDRRVRELRRLHARKGRVVQIHAGLHGQRDDQLVQLQLDMGLRVVDPHRQLPGHDEQPGQLQ